MPNLSDIRKDNVLVNEIDWEMTPEKAVSLYLEWGNGWNHGVRMVRSKEDVAYYFVVYNWDEVPVVHLVRRDNEGAEELAHINLPEELVEEFRREWGHHHGVYAPTPGITAWLKRELGVEVAKPH